MVPGGSSSVCCHKKINKRVKPIEQLLRFEKRCRKCRKGIEDATVGKSP